MVNCAAILPSPPPPPPPPSRTGHAVSTWAGREKRLQEGTGRGEQGKQAATEATQACAASDIVTVVVAWPWALTEG